MNKNLSKGARPEATRWNKEHTVYICTDGVDVQAPKRVFRQGKNGSKDANDSVHVSGLGYNKSAGRKHVRLFISGTEFNRDISQVIQGAKDVRTITFPDTVRDVPYSAFLHTTLLSVVLNEGLETLGKCQARVYHEVFSHTQLRHVRLPSTLQVLGNGTFLLCENLQEVVFEEGSRLEIIGECAFASCFSLKSIFLPEGLEAIGEYAF